MYLDPFSIGWYRTDKWTMWTITNVCQREKERDVLENGCVAGSATASCPLPLSEWMNLHDFGFSSKSKQRQTVRVDFQWNVVITNSDKRKDR